MIDKRIAEWLGSNDTGSSSKAIMLWLSSGTTSGTWGPDTPSDVGDLGRCMRLLERIPEWKGRMSEMAAAGGLWPTFSKHWPAIVEIYLDECGGTVPDKGSSASCPKTYTLLKRVHEEAYANDRPAFIEASFCKGTTVRFAR